MEYVREWGHCMGGVNGEAARALKLRAVERRGDHGVETSKAGDGGGGACGWGNSSCPFRINSSELGCVGNL